MDIYDLYKPFRNQVKRLALRPALERIWAYQHHAQVSGVLTLTVQGGRKFEIYVWELHLLCREIVLHAEGDEDTLSTVNGLVELVNHIRRIDEQISARLIDSGDSAMRALHPRIHQQARWQNVRYEAILFRAFDIYGAQELTPMVERATGMSVRIICTVAIILAGAAKRHPYTSAEQDYSALGVSAAARDRFFERTAATPEQLREELRLVQRYDEAWAFTWNALEKYPLIRLDVDGTPGVCCPLPDLLLRRVTEGLFYDVLNTDRRFGNWYGKAFERHVGKVLHDVFSADRFAVVPEQVYMIGKRQKHGVDWIVEDGTGNLFVECKTRRMGWDAKTTVDGVVLDAAIEELAGAIVQHYRNIVDAEQGFTKWKPNGSPIYPIVVTYEDWYLFAPYVVEQLIDAVRRRLAEVEMASTLVDTMPFFVTSIDEFEKAGQAIAHIGIQRFCEACAESGHRHFQLSGFAEIAFPDERISYRPLLQGSWQAIFSHIPHVLQQIPEVERQAMARMQR